MPDDTGLGPVLSAATEYGAGKQREGFDAGWKEASEQFGDDIDALTKYHVAALARIAELEAALRPTMLVGAAVGGNSDPKPLEDALGRPLDLRRTYYGGGTAEVNRAVTRATTDLSAGRIPFISFKAPEPWVDMALGKGNSWAIGIAQRLDQLAGDVRVVVHHEPEGDQPDIADWTGMQRQLAPIFDRGRVKFGICLTGYPQVRPAATKGAYALDVIYPRGVPIKFLAVDLYQRYGTTDAGLKWTPLDEFFAHVATFAAQVGVPWGLAETGVTDEAHAKDPAAVATLFDTARKHGAGFLTYFSSALNSKGSWPLTGDKLAAFVTAANTART